MQKVVSQFLTQFIKQLELKLLGSKLQSLVTYAFKSQTIVSNLKSCMHLEFHCHLSQVLWRLNTFAMLAINQSFQVLALSLNKQDWYDIVEKQ